MAGFAWLVRAWTRLVRGDPARWNDARLGLAGEREVARMLRVEGEVLLATRLRSSSAEIDLLSRDRHGRLWLHEVKTPRESPLPALAAKRTRGSLSGRVRATQAGRLERARSALSAARREEVGIKLWSVRVDASGKFFATPAVLREPRRT